MYGDLFADCFFVRKVNVQAAFTSSHCSLRSSTAHTVVGEGQVHVQLLRMYLQRYMHTQHIHMHMDFSCSALCGLACTCYSSNKTFPLPLCSVPFHSLKTKWNGMVGHVQSTTRERSCVWSFHGYAHACFREHTSTVLECSRKRART